MPSGACKRPTHRGRGEMLLISARQAAVPAKRGAINIPADTAGTALSGS